MKGTTKDLRKKADRLKSSMMGRLYMATFMLFSAVVLGTIGYHLLGQGRWAWPDCLYMTIITLSTVGFGETLPGMDDLGMARAWTVALIVMGSGTLLYFVSLLTAAIVEGDLRGLLQGKRMQRSIDALSGHTIVCGGGQTGFHIIEELMATGYPFVVIERSAQRREELLDLFEGRCLVVAGDATDDHTLEAAGIQQAGGLAATLPDDRDNLFVVVTARSHNEKLRIVAKAVEQRSIPKMRRSGANAVISPYFIGGMRMVSELIRPTVVKFLDRMLRDTDKNIRIEEVPIPEGSPLDGRTLAESELRRIANVLVLAVHSETHGDTYNPDGAQRLLGGMTLVVMGAAGEVANLRGVIAPGNLVAKHDD